MKKTEFRFISSDGIHRIHGVRWIPDTKPKAVLQITHGMCEYIERYEEFAAFLCEQGFIVTGHDHLGHGDSVFTEDELGFFALGRPCPLLLKDMHRLSLHTQRLYPDLPYFMLGHSMGSYLLRCYLSVYQPEIAGAIIMGTGFESPLTAAFAVGLCHVLAAVRGWRYRSRLIQQLTMDSGAYRAFNTDGKDPANSWLSKNVENVQEYYANKKCRFRFTLNGYLGLLEAVRMSCSRSAIRRIPAKLPLMVISGEEDPVGNMGEGVKEFARCLEHHGMQDLQCVLLPGDRHEVLNETDRREVFRLLLNWMEQRMQRMPGM